MPPWVYLVASMAITDTLQPTSQARLAARDDRWLATDKLQHVTVSFAAAAGSYAVLRGVTTHREAVIGAGVAALALGVYKEMQDRPTTGFSLRDLAWDAAGVAAALFLVSHGSRGR